MIRLLGEVPRDIIVACSVGIDSMVLLNYLRRKHSVEVAFFNHGTETSRVAETFIRGYCRKNDIVLHVGKTSSEPNKGQSLEEFWRNQRYGFLDGFEKPVVVAHHLNDVLETWIFSCANGNPKVIPYRRNNVIRPFLATPKSDILQYATRFQIPYLDDDSNNDLRFMRNYIRHKMVEDFQVVNKGILKVMKKKVLQEYSELNKSS